MRLRSKSAKQREWQARREAAAMTAWRGKRQLHDALDALEAETTAAQRKQLASACMRSAKD